MSARHALVTGASSGIGAAIVARLLDEGWRVTGVSRSAPATARAGSDHIAFDLARTQEIARAMDGLTPTALVHAAGVMRGATLGALDAAAGQEMWRLHIDHLAVDGATMSLIVSLSGGALVANLISVMLLIGETLRQTR